MPERERQGLRIEQVLDGSPARRAGISPGEWVRSVNGKPVSDLIDFFFHKAAARPAACRMEIKPKNGPVRRVSLQMEEGEETGIVPAQFKVRTCRNKCLFCFVAQLPRGLRKSLYVKDEDYRMSFLYGSYITMTNLSDKDRRRIEAQRLSPLYISVHSTEQALRNRMLGNPGAADIMKELAWLKKVRVRSHVQVVLCPGLNDGSHLEKTIRDLYLFYPYVRSVAVVPVGLTSHRKTKMRPVGKEDAALALRTIRGFQKRFSNRHGDPIVYGADELYIKAEAPFPALAEYGELPQIENGAGLVPQFIAESKNMKITPAGDKKIRYLTYAGASFHPYLKKFTERLGKSGYNITALPVENRFFGESVTVSGLLTGRDVLRSTAPHTGSHDILLVPDIALRDGKNVFLDDVAVPDLEAALGLEVKVIESTARGLVKALE